MSLSEPRIADGRVRRGQANRSRIVDALIALVREGHMHPPAAAIAERADVGLRTVFRQFEDMESLYQAMFERLEREIAPELLAPLPGRTWRKKLAALVARRSRLYERILPLKVAAGVRRFQSDYLMTAHGRFARAERAALAAIAPADFLADTARFEALDMALSFEAWRRMRQDQLLSPEAGLAAMLACAEALAGPLAG